MSDLLTPKHIDDLVNTDRIVVRYYKGKKLLSKIEFTPTTLEEYLKPLNDSVANTHGGDSGDQGAMTENQI